MHYLRRDSILQAIPFGLLILATIALEVIQVIFFKLMTDACPVVPYFILVSCSCAFVLVYGGCYVVSSIYSRFACNKEDWIYRPPTSKVNHSRLATLGVCGCLNGVLVLFASSRTPGALQSILTESLIPLTMIMSYFLLQRSYQKKELGSALVVLLGIGVALIPTIINMAKNPKNIAQSGWPLIFFLGKVPGAFLNVGQEKFTQNMQVDRLHLLFWQSSYQLLADILFLPWNFVPGTGMTLEKWGDLLTHFTFGSQCWFGIGQHCKNKWFGVYTVMYVMSYTLVYYWSTRIIERYSSTLVSIVSTPTAPITAIIFLIMGKDKPHWVIFIALPIIVLGVVLYEIAEFKNKNSKRLLLFWCNTSSDDDESGQLMPVN